MRSLALVVLMAVAVAAGCNNKKKDTPTDGVPAGDNTPKADPKKDTSDGKSGGRWYRPDGDDKATDPNANNQTTTTGNQGGNGPGIVVTGAGGGVVTNPMAVTGGGGGGGAAMAVRKAATRTEVRVALTDIRLTIDTFSLTDGKMPTPKQTLEMVKQAAPKYGKLIEDGDIVIHPARTREDIWAYEGKPTGQRVMVLTSQGVEDLDVLDLKQRLGR